MNIKTKQSGFTIVELLIVVVVIAILAAITLVSFNNITNRANQSAAKETASNVQKKVGLYNAEKSAYPTIAQLTAGTTDSWYTDSSLVSASAPDASTGKGKIQYLPCGTTGARIIYWNYGATDDTALTSSTTKNIRMLGSGCSNNDTP